MPIPVVMPHLGESVAEGTVLEWLKREGDPVDKDEPLLAISTEKVDAEVPAPTRGVLSRILVQAGQAVPVGSTLAEIEPREEQRSAVSGQRSAESLFPSSVSAAPVLDHSSQSAIRNPQSAIPPPPPLSPSPPHRLYSPAVMQLAGEHGIDLSLVQGTGEGGRVTKRDVERFLDARRQPESRAPVARLEEDGEELVPLTKMRRAIAERMLRSAQTSPQVTSVIEADFTAIARFRAERQGAFREATGMRLTFLPFIVKATAHLLGEFRFLNAQWSEEGIRLRRGVHLGIAMAVGDGLAVPVLRSPAGLAVSEIAVRIGEMVRRAREGRLQPGELAGSTFTVNNFGADGNLIGTPLLNPPEAGILGVGTIEKRPVIVTRDGEDVIGIRPMGYLCLSYDHRVVDGATAGRFLQALRTALQSFRAGQGIWADPLLS